jgi:fluoride exporter
VTPLLVVLGALVGAPLRLLAVQHAAHVGRDPSLGTLAVNVVGGGLLGVLVGLGGLSADVLALIGTGFCGTLTTFSTFGADVVRLVEERTLLRALAYVAASLVLGLGAAAAGYMIIGAD